MSKKRKNIFFKSQKKRREVNKYVAKLDKKISCRGHNNHPETLHLQVFGIFCICNETTINYPMLYRLHNTAKPI